MRKQSLLSLSTLSLAAALLSGCGIGPITQMSEGTLAIQGKIFGGQQAVVGSTIQLFTAGKTGNGSAATSMLTTPVISGIYGSFSITGDYSCASAEDQVYIVASGGNPGLSAGSNNPALVMMDPLGRCGDLSSASYITINEITTAASAYALAQFMVDASHIGASATNTVGLKNAFLDAKLLVDTQLGTAPTLAANLIVEKDKLYALADALAPCVNSTGGTTCTPLFTASTPPAGSPSTAAPTNTLAAALNVAKYPGNNVTAVFNCIAPQPPFPTALTTAPNDWTMSLTVSGGGINTPEALAIDNLGNVWVASYNNVLSAFTPQGTPLSATGFGSGLLSESFGITVDASNNIWVANQELPSHSPGHGSLVKFQGASGASPGSPIPSPQGGYFIYDPGMSFPTALATDTNGNIMIANYANSSGSVYSSGGTIISGSLGSGNSAFPVSVAPDLNHGMWLANQGDDTVTHVDVNANVLGRPSCCSGANGIAVDTFGTAWVANYYGGNVSAIFANGTLATLVDGGMDGGLSTGYPNGIALDAAQNVWVTDFRGTAISAVYGSAGTQPAGTAISPANGFGLDANLLLPFSIAPDASGNVWVSNNGNNNVVMFFGLAAPTATPRIGTATAP